MRRLALDEQETTFTIEATSRSTVRVYSGDSVWQARLEKAGTQLVGDSPDGGKFYLLDARQLRVRSMAQVLAASKG